MADMMSTLRGILGDGADEKIKNAMSMLEGSGLVQKTEESQEEGVAVKNNNQPMPLTPESLEMISQLKSMVDRISTTNDSRSELLRSLRPFMRSERQRSIDKAIRLINIGRFSGIIGK